LNSRNLREEVEAEGAADARADPVGRAPPDRHVLACRQREVFIDNLLVQIHFIIVVIRWTGLAPWEF